MRNFILQTRFYKVIDVFVQQSRVLVDEFVGQRLRRPRVVELVVSVSSEAHDVHHAVPVEGLPPPHRELTDRHHRLDVVAVDVEYGRADSLGGVGAVVGGAGRPRLGGEADLVVHDDVYAA